MKKLFNLQWLMFVLACAVALPSLAGDLRAPKTVLRHSVERVVLRVHFSAPTTGDLYLALQVDGELVFITQDNDISYDSTPFRAKQTYSGEYLLLDIPTEVIAPGQYLVYQLTTRSRGNPYRPADWLGGINSIRLSIGENAAISGDWNGDGFADDDLNHDGFHDDDQDQDGFHDDDYNQDRYHDDDVNQDGFSDEDLNHDGVVNELDYDFADNNEENQEEDIQEDAALDGDSGMEEDRSEEEDPQAQEEPKEPLSGENGGISPADQGADNGQTLFTTHCSGCHTPQRIPANASLMRTAIQTNRGGMGRLDFLTEDELAQIAAYVGNL